MKTEPLVGPEFDHGVLALLVAVPEADRANPGDDIAEAYAVETGVDIPGGCLIWGRYRGHWVANVSGRWLLSRFIRGAALMRDNLECGGDGWWKGWSVLASLVTMPE